MNLGFKQTDYAVLLFSLLNSLVEMNKKHTSYSTYAPYTPKKTFIGFNSIVCIDPKCKVREALYSSREFQQKPIGSSIFRSQRQSSKVPSFLNSSERTHFKSTDKTTFCVKSSKDLDSSSKLSSGIFLKRRQFISTKQIQFREEKQLRESDSTKCHTPKAIKNTDIKMSDFKKLRLIGNGKYGNVYMVKHHKTGFIAALKVIRKIDIDNLQKEEREKMINQIIRQIKIQSYLDHPNLVKLYKYFSDDYNIYLLMELGCDGQLYDLMKKKPRLQESSVSIITREVLQGLSYMHRAQVIHRDIKPENIVLIHGFAKICDFGWSVGCSKQLRSTLCGTPLYLSPQILKGNLYNEKIDTWAIGTLAYELRTSENPFKIKKKQDLSKIVTEDFVIKSGSTEFKSFITSILKKDPLRRPDAEKLKTHEFIRTYKDIQTSQQICDLVYCHQNPVYRSNYK